ncbi:phosphoribosyl pyrophosphate synthetase, conserved site-containing protein, partial [Tanacetum coccineum]
MYVLLIYNSLVQTQGRESIAAKFTANLITAAGAYRVLACDLHSGKSMGYFDIPPVILEYLASKSICSSDLVVVSPDVSGVSRSRAFAKKLSDAPLEIVDKRCHGHNIAEVINLIDDVKGKVSVMVNDVINTADSVIQNLKAKLKALTRKADVLELELQTLRNKIVKEMKKGQDLLKEVATLKEELKGYHNREEVKESQESNAELVLALEKSNSRSTKQEYAVNRSKPLPNTQGRESIAAKLTANLITAADADADAVGLGPEEAKANYKWHPDMATQLIVALDGDSMGYAEHNVPTVGV